MKHVLALALLFTLAGCGGTPSPSDRFDVMCFLPIGPITINSSKIEILEGGILAVHKEKEKGEKDDIILVHSLACVVSRSVE